MKKLYLLLLVVAVAGVAQAEGDVLKLTADNFDTVVAQDFVVVKFFAPWCGHCKHLAPEYEKAAGILKSEGVVLTEVDATEETALASKYGVNGYPTLYIFRKGVKQEYKGPREADGIVKYLRKQAGPSVAPLTNADELKALTAKSPVVVVAYLTSDKIRMASRFDELANKLRDDYTFASFVGEDVIKSVGYEKSEIVIYRKWPTEKDQQKITYESKSLDSDRLEQWVKDNSFPPVGVYDEDTAPKYRAIGKPLVMLFTAIDFKNNAKQSVYYANRLLKVSRDFPDMMYVVADAKARQSDVDAFGGMKGDILVGIQDHKSNQKYLMETPFSQDNLRAFVEKFEKNELESYIKSEPVPKAEPLGEVRTVVARTFDELVKNSDKDVMIMLYAPWCGHCKKLHPIFEDLAKKMKKYPSVMIAKLDATANDLPADYSASGYPTVYMHPKGAKSPKKYDGDRTVEALERFIKENAATSLKKSSKAKEDL